MVLKKQFNTVWWIRGVNALWDERVMVELKYGHQPIIPGAVLDFDNSGVLLDDRCAKLVALLVGQLLLYTTYAKVADQK